VERAETRLPQTHKDAYQQVHRLEQTMTSKQSQLSSLHLQTEEMLVEIDTEAMKLALAVEQRRQELKEIVLARHEQRETKLKKELMEVEIMMTYLKNLTEEESKFRLSTKKVPEESKERPISVTDGDYDLTVEASESTKSNSDSENLGKLSNSPSFAFSFYSDSVSLVNHEIKTRQATDYANELLPAVMKLSVDTEHHLASASTKVHIHFDEKLHHMIETTGNIDIKRNSSPKQSRNGCSYSSLNLMETFSIEGGGKEYVLCLSETMIASALTDIQIWNIKTKECEAILHGHTNSIWMLIQSYDDTILASGSGDTTIRLWDMKSNTCINTLCGHTSTVRSLAFSPDDSYLASGSADETIGIWDVSSGYCYSVLIGHEDWINCLLWKFDGLQLVSGSSDKTIRVWDVANGQCIKTLVQSDEVEAIQLSKDDVTLFSGSSLSIRKWNLDTAKCLNVIKLSVKTEPYLYLMVLSSDEKFINTAVNNYIDVYDLALQTNINSFQYESETKEVYYPGSVVLSEDRRLIMDNHIHIWEAQEKLTDSI
jgi:WD40 repeat protein